MDVSTIIWNTLINWYLTVIVRLLDLVKFFVPILPEVEFPDEAISFDERIVFTIASGVIYLFGQLPLYGLVSNAAYKIGDPLFNLRPIFSLEKATLLELGLLPIVSSALLWQLAAGLKLIKVNFNLRSDRELFQSGQKLTSFFLSFVYGIGLIYSGYYDNVIQGYNPVTSTTSPYGSYLIILLQIVAWPCFLTLLVEIFDKGYAFGSGLLSFITLQVATNLVIDLISFDIIQLANSNKLQIRGIFTNLIRNYKNLPSILVNSFGKFSQFYIAIATIFALIYLQNLRIEIPIRSSKMRGMSQSYPIRLLYNGGLPVLFSYALLANIQFLGYCISKIFNLSILGSWELDQLSNNLILKSGILYYFNTFSPSVLGSLLSPIKTVIYSLSVIILSTWFANKWSNISGSSPKDISKQFKEQGIVIAGKREVSVTKELSRIIPVAAVSGAFSLAAISVFSDIVGGYGKGVGVVIGITSAFGVLEEFMLEYQQTGGNSQFSSAFSG